MGTLAQFLLGIVGPMAVRALLAIGLGVITIQGVEIGINALLNQIASYSNALPGDMAAILGIMGIGQGLAVVMGGVSFLVSYMVAGKAFSFFGVVK